MRKNHERLVSCGADVDTCAAALDGDRFQRQASMQFVEASSPYAAAVCAAMHQGFMLGSDVCRKQVDLESLVVDH